MAEKKIPMKEHLYSLKNSDHVGRVMSAEALADYGEKAIPPLAEALEDKALSVRLEAAKSLMKLGDERGIRKIIELAIGERGLAGDESTGEIWPLPENRLIWDAKKILREMNRDELTRELIKMHEDAELGRKQGDIEKLIREITEGKDAD